MQSSLPCRAGFLGKYLNRVIATVAHVRSTWSQPRSSRRIQTQNAQSSRVGASMKTETMQAETTLDSNLTRTAEGLSKVEALKELAEFELAYVGGGTAAVIFQ